MKIKVTITTFLLLLISTTLFAQDSAQRNFVAWQVKNFDITASPSDRVLTVRASMNLVNVGNMAGTRLTLRINEKAEISNIQVNGSTAVFNKGQEKVSSNRILQRAIVNLPSTSPNQSISVNVDYKLTVDENSGLQAISPLGLQFLPSSFWYPTPNSHYAPRGSDFAPFKLTVNNSPGTLISSGTGSGSQYEQRLNGQPFFLTGNWETIESKGVTVYLPKGATDAERQRANELGSLVAEASTYTASLLGTIPSVPLRIVAVRRGAGFADGGTILLDYAAFRRTKIDSHTAMTIADSVAKMWLGNAKLVSGDSYNVIREGLSRYVATLFIEKQFGKAVADSERFRQLTAYAAVAQNDSPFNIASPLDSTYYASVTYKGAMIWRNIANQMGRESFFNTLKQMNSYSIPDIRSALVTQYEVLDYPLTNNTDTNLLAGLPQTAGGVTKVAVRNTGSITVTVNVQAITEKGERLLQQTSIPPKSFGEVTFNTSEKIIRTEIDPEKFYPQTEYSDDVAPREFTDSNPIVVIKRAFDKQDYPLAEKSARTILQNHSYLSDAQVWLGRALLAENKLTEADTVFQNALKDPLPTPFVLAWANVGLGEIALKSSQNSEAAKHFAAAVSADAEYGSTLAGRLGGQKLNSPTVDESIRTFFTQFDKAVTTARKTEVEALIVPGEITRFSGGVVGGQPERWITTVVRTEPIDDTYTLAETTLSVKRLGSENIETGTAVFVIAKVGGNWRLAGVEVFEVR